MEQEKKYGLYPGSLNNNIQKKLINMSEDEVFKLIHYIEGEIFWSQQEDRNHTVDIEELKEKYYALDYVIYSTSKFDIKFSKPSTKRLEKNQDYLSWYNSWNNKIFKQTLVKEKIKR